MERSFQLLGVHLLFLLCASAFRARLASHFAWSLTRPPFVLQRRRIGTALSFSTPIESFERTRACRSGLWGNIAPAACRIYRILAPSWSSVMALSIGIRSRSILNGTHTVPLQHSHPIQRITSASSWEIVRLSAIRPSNRDRA